MTFDFTLKKYAQLCEVILRLDCPVLTVREFLQEGNPKGFSIVLRHDVDRQMDAALRMAALETQFGINSTYYVRQQPSVFRPEAIEHLNTLGHEVGYHYEVLSKTKGDPQKAIQLFSVELKQFRRIVPVSTISMHGSPMSPWNNSDLWSVYNFKEHEIVGDAVLSLDDEGVFYFTDTGRAWDADRYNIRDSMRSLPLAKPPHRTDDLISFLRKRTSFPVFINAHPNRWAANMFDWGTTLFLDWAINQAKWLFASVRSYRE